MVLLTIKMNSLTENRSELFQTLLSITTLIRKEKNCLNCHLFQDLENGNSFCLIASWESQDDLDLHLQSRNFSVLLGTKSLLREPPDVAIHTVSSTAGIEQIRLARGFEEKKGRGDNNRRKNEEP